MKGTSRAEGEEAEGEAEGEGEAEREGGRQRGGGRGGRGGGGRRGRAETRLPTRKFLNLWLPVASESEAAAAGPSFPRPPDPSHSWWGAFAPLTLAAPLPHLAEAGAALRGGPRGYEMGSGSGVTVSPSAFPQPHSVTPGRWPLSLGLSPSGCRNSG